MKEFLMLLSVSDLRSIGNSNAVVLNIGNQNDFDDLFKCLFDTDRKVFMRASDAIEKITLKNADYLKDHKKEILHLCESTIKKELKWHLAQSVPRLILTKRELENVWKILIQWSTDKNESRIVRVNSIQSHYDLMTNNQEFENEFNLEITQIENENLPSLNARIRKIKNASC